MESGVQGFPDAESYSPESRNVTDNVVPFADEANS